MTEMKSRGRANDVKPTHTVRTISINLSVSAALAWVKMIQENGSIFPKTAFT